MTVTGLLATVVGWAAFYGGIGAVLGLAHFGMHPADRLPPRASLGIAAAMGVLPFLVLPSGPGSQVAFAGGAFVVLRSVLRLSLLFVVGVVFGLLGFIAYVIASDPHDGSAYW